MATSLAPTAPAVAQPARAPFASYVAGAGIVEASTENIAVGTPVSGIVTAIYVKWADRVTAGDPLFKIDDRDLQAPFRYAAFVTVCCWYLYKTCTVQN